MFFSTIFSLFSEIWRAPALCIQDGELDGEQSVFKSTLSTDDPEFSRAIKRERPGLGTRLKREVKRAFYRLKSRAGIRVKIRNTFPREEASALKDDGDKPV